MSEFVCEVGTVEEGVVDVVGFIVVEKGLLPAEANGEAAEAKDANGEEFPVAALNPNG